MKIKRWLDRRSDSLTKSKAPTKIDASGFVAAIAEELGKDKAEAFVDLVKSEARSTIYGMPKDMEPLEFVQKYLTDKSFVNQVNASIKSNFQRDLLKKQVGEFASRLGKDLQNLAISDLSKAVKAKDWSRITKKVDPDAGLLVDHKPHITQFPVHGEYSKMLAHPDKMAAHKDDNIEGIAAKMLHAIPRPPSEQTLFMAKPYHKKLESHTRDWVKKPITGWATMATKALFNAGNIGHLAEDVSAHEHEGTPLTVHKFAEDHKPIGAVMQWQPRGGYRIERTVDPVDIHKIGVMDYLANNLDRHQGNLMVGSHSDSRGYDPVLAIDHERNFQYVKPIKDSALNRRQRQMFGQAAGPYQTDLDKETPWAYIKGSVLNHAHQSGNGWHSHGDLVDWWNQHGSNIRDEMENQLGSIKDEESRKHIRGNFMDRWHKMDKWAKQMAADPDSAHMYHPSSLGEAFESARIQKPEVPRITQASIKSLPKNKRDALFTIADMVNRKPKLSYRQQSMLSGAIDSIINTMSPEEAADAFKSLANNPYLETKAIKENPDVNPKNKMLRHFWENHGYDQNNEPVYKRPHMEALANVIESMPEEKRGMLSSWATDYRNRLNRGAA